MKAYPMHSLHTLLIIQCDRYNRYIQVYTDSVFDGVLDETQTKEEHVIRQNSK